MCGIIATFGHEPIQNTLEQFKKQRSRGYEGFGFLALKNQKIVAFERSTTEGGIRVRLQAAEALKPDAILFHHRYPTSTINAVPAAHPLPIKKKGWKHNYYMLHNGVVSGQDEQAIRKDGYKFRSTVEEITWYRAGGKVYEKILDSEINDSEYLGYYVASFLEGQRADIPMTGAIACIVLQENKKTGKCEVYAMRNYSNPLKVTRTKKGQHTFMLSSEGDGPLLEAHELHRVSWDKLTLALEKKVNVGKVYEYTGSTSTTKYATPYYFPDAKKEADKKVAMGFISQPSSDAIIEREINRLELKAEAAHEAYMEEADAFRDQLDDPEVVEYLEGLRKEWVDLEQEINTIVDVEPRDSVMPELQ